MNKLEQNAVDMVAALANSISIPFCKEWWLTVGKRKDNPMPFTIAGYPNEYYYMEVASGATVQEAVDKFTARIRTPAKLRIEAQVLLAKASELEAKP